MIPRSWPASLSTNESRAYVCQVAVAATVSSGATTTKAAAAQPARPRRRRPNHSAPPSVNATAAPTIVRVKYKRIPSDSPDNTGCRNPHHPLRHLLHPPHGDDVDVGVDLRGVGVGDDDAAEA